MSLRAVQFVALLFAGLVLIPSGAHLAEFSNKMDFSRDEYLTAQQIYRGWALFGFVIFGALVSTLALAIKMRRVRPTFRLAMIALLCLIGGQAIFWVFTFPANQATANWTVLPADWADLRVQWEYSHAVGAVLNLAAFVALTLAVLDGGDIQRRIGRSGQLQQP
jgi:hypothetical protein